MKNKFVYIIILTVLLVVGLVFSYSKADIVVTIKKDIFPEPPKETISVLSFGDVMFDRGVRNIMENRGRDPFEHIKREGAFISDFDVVIANLEGPIVEMPRAECQQKAYNFQFASDTPERLKSIGITMVTIANNHSYDCYAQGVVSTKKSLQEAGIDYIGSSKQEESFVIKTIHNKKVAFIGLDQTISPGRIGESYPLVKRLKAENDYVIVHIHWGNEYELVESATQKKIAHALVDNGADVIFGHHPHVTQPVEVYKGKAIFYSLGNFVFDQTGEHQIQGIGASVELGESKDVLSIYPYKIKTFAPDFLEEEEKEMFCNKFLQKLEHTGCSFTLTKEQLR